MWHRRRLSVNLSALAWLGNEKLFCSRLARSCRFVKSARRLARLIRINEPWS